MTSKHDWYYGRDNIEYLDFLDYMGYEINKEDTDWWRNYIYENSYMNPYPNLISFVGYRKSSKPKYPHGLIRFYYDKNETNEIQGKFRILENDRESRENTKQIENRCKPASLDKESRSYSSIKKKWWVDELHQPTLDENKKLHDALIVNERKNIPNNTIWKPGHSWKSKKEIRYHSTYWCKDIKSYISINESSLPKQVYMWSKEYN